MSFRQGLRSFLSVIPGLTGFENRFSLFFSIWKSRISLFHLSAFWLLEREKGSICIMIQNRVPSEGCTRDVVPHVLARGGHYIVGSCQVPKKNNKILKGHSTSVFRKKSRRFRTRLRRWMLQKQMMTHPFSLLGRKSSSSATVSSGCGLKNGLPFSNKDFPEGEVRRRTTPLSAHGHSDEWPALCWFRQWPSFSFSILRRKRRACPFRQHLKLEDDDGETQDRQLSLTTCAPSQRVLGTSGRCLLSKQHARA